MESISKMVILDTNFCMVPFLYKVDLFKGIESKINSAHHICVPSMVLTELAGIKGKKSKDAPKAAATLKWLQKKIENHEVKLMITTDSVDDWIVDFAQQKENKDKIVVCTNDVALRKTLKKKRVKVISLLGKKKLTIS
jgi:rRNA-processing protein FCF1